MTDDQLLNVTIRDVSGGHTRVLVFGELDAVSDALRPPAGMRLDRVSIDAPDKHQMFPGTSVVEVAVQPAAGVELAEDRVPAVRATGVHVVWSDR